MYKLLFISLLLLFLSCNRHSTTISAGYGKIYNSEPTGVIDSVLASRGLTEADIKWQTKSYADNFAGEKTMVLASTALYRMPNDSTLIISLFSYDGQYRLNWRIEKEEEIDY